jgi:hypothetical protein
MRRPFLLSASIGVFVILVGLILNIIGPAPSAGLKGGFLTPVIAFEFATETEQLTAIFGPPASAVRQTMLHKMTNSTLLDFIFLILYGAFLLTFALTGAALTRKRILYLAAVLALLAPLFDVLENLQLLAIMAQITTHQNQIDLLPLHIFTWLKWGSLAVTFALLVPLLRTTCRFGHIIALIALINLILCFAAYIWPGLLNELFAVTTVLIFILLIIFSFTYKYGD